MISPYVRRRRLAAELRHMREEHGYSAHRLADQIGVARQTISRLENGHVSPDEHVVMKILRLFDVDQKQWNQLTTIAQEARERGWWAPYAHQMGRQALYADLEAGAVEIREYHLNLLPGLLQIPPYAEARLHAGREASSGELDPARVLQARAGRQQMLERPGGPAYEAILDETAVRRHAAPPDVVGQQLDHLIHIGHYRDNVTIRVLPTAAMISGHLPRSAFFCYRYPPDDPRVVAVDTITDDLVLTSIDKPGEVDSYLDLYEHLRATALSPADSLDFLITLTEQLAHQPGR